MKKQSPLVEARSRVGKLVKSAALLAPVLLMAVSSSVSVHGASGIRDFQRTQGAEKGATDEK